jgi:hypothetical protein
MHTTIVMQLKQNRVQHVPYKSKWQDMTPDETKRCSVYNLNLPPIAMSKHLLQSMKGPGRGGDLLHLGPSPDLTLAVRLVAWAPYQTWTSIGGHRSLSCWSQAALKITFSYKPEGPSHQSHKLQKSEVKLQLHTVTKEHTGIMHIYWKLQSDTIKLLLKLHFRSIITRTRYFYIKLYHIYMGYLATMT